MEFKGTNWKIEIEEPAPEWVGPFLAASYEAGVNPLPHLRRLGFTPRYRGVPVFSARLTEEARSIIAALCEGRYSFSPSGDWTILRLSDDGSRFRLDSGIRPSKYAHGWFAGFINGDDAERVVDRLNQLGGPIRFIE